MGALVTIFAPDGTQGQVPQSQVQAAVQKGAKIGVHVYAPDGSEGYVPQDRLADAIHAGAHVDAPDQRNFVQKAMDRLTTVTPEDEAGHSAIVNRAQEFGAGAIQGFTAPFVHPEQTAIALKNAIVHPMDTAKAAADYAAAHPAQAAGQFVGGVDLGGATAAAAPAVAGAMRSAAAKVPAITEPIANAASTVRQYVRPASSPAIVPQSEVQAQNLAKAILPPGGIKPEMLNALHDEAAAVKEYAARTGNPLNTQAEGLKAAQGVAQEGLAHFNDQILTPNAGERIALQSGKSDLGASATLGQINDEITSLNKQVSTAKAANAGEAMTIMAKKGGVMDQLAYLRNELYSNLSDKTGIPADQLQTLREGYGGQFTMADALESAQNARLTRTGQRSQGQQTMSTSTPKSVADIAVRGYQGLKGGEQAIADRQFSAAMSKIEPQAPARPVPTVEPEPVPSTGPQRWQLIGRNNVARHIGQDLSSGLTNADLNAVAKTPEGQQLLVKASDLSPGTAAMKQIVNQIVVQADKARGIKAVSLPVVK